MTDRELLEAAAKAAGFYITDEWQGHERYKPKWNPLTDDGDALRLAVKLGISVKFSGHLYSVSRRNVYDICCEWEGPDRCSLIRRMIVTEAAAMGKP